jgi:hypothetical protein
VVDRPEIEPVFVFLFAFPSSQFASVIEPVKVVRRWTSEVGHSSDGPQSQLSFGTYSVCDRWVFALLILESQSGGRRCGERGRVRARPLRRSLVSAVWFACQECGNGPEFATFYQMKGRNSLPSRLDGGASVIRTRIIVLNYANPDLRVTCRRCGT